MFCRQVGWKIALGFEKVDSEAGIGVYDADGSFLYSLLFKRESFELEWMGEYLNIYNYLGQELNTVKGMNRGTYWTSIRRSAVEKIPDMSGKI